MPGAFVREAVVASMFKAAVVGAGGQVLAARGDTTLAGGWASVTKICTALALLVANGPFAEPYAHALHAALGPMSVQHWINDGLMAGFFLLVGLEIKREALDLARKAPGSPLHGLRPADLRAIRSGLFRADVPAGAEHAGETYAAILVRAGRGYLEARTGSDNRFRAAVGQARFMAGFLNDRRKWVRAATGAHFCEVTVDEDTGEVFVAESGAAGYVTKSAFGPDRLEAAWSAATG